jgi:hypothetical protein
MANIGCCGNILDKKSVRYLLLRARPAYFEWVIVDAMMPLGLFFNPES